jgi:hypothetical protein
VKRWYALLGATILAVPVGVPAAHAQDSAESTPVTLSPDAGHETRTLNFGEERGQKTVTIRFLAAAPLEDAPEGDLTDAQTSTGEKLEGSVRITRVTLKQGNRTVLVTVAAEPTSNDDAGSFDSQLLLRGTGVTDARSKLTITLAAEPVSGAWLFALVLLVVGAGVGVFARWLGTEAVGLKRLQDRLAGIEAMVAGHEQRLPLAFKVAVVQARSQIANEEASAAGTTLTDLEAKAQAAVAAAAATARLQDLLAAQEQSIAAMPNLGAAASRLRQVLARELSFADEFAAADYSSDAARQRRAELLADAQRFSGFLPHYAVESKRPALDEALELFEQGKFAEAEQAWTAAMDAEAPLGVTQETPPEPAARMPTSKGTVRGWLIRHSPDIWLGISAGAIALLGVFAVYDPSETFRSEPFLDAVELFAWGLGSALAGAGIADLAGKLTAPRSP